MNVAVIGAGTMGSGIAITTVLGGHDICLIDVDEPRVSLGEQQVVRFLERSVSLGKLTETEGAATQGRVRYSTSMKDASDADVVIEAVFEDVPIKQALFAQLDDLCRPDALFHSNTSTLSVTALTYPALT